MEKRDEQGGVALLLGLLRLLAQFVVGAGGGFLLGLLGVLVGSIIGANVAPNFVFAGNRGYEASAGIGWLLAIIPGIPTLVYAVSRLWDRTGGYVPTLMGSVIAAAVLGSFILASPQLRLPELVIPLIAVLTLAAITGYNTSQILSTDAE